MPFFNVIEYGDSTRTGERFLYDGHTSSNLNVGINLIGSPPPPVGATGMSSWCSSGSMFTAMSVR